MARIAFILILLLWLVRPQEAAALPAAWKLGVFLGAYAAMLAIVRAAALAFASRSASPGFERRTAAWTNRLQRIRLLVVGWFGCGVYLLGWPAWAQWAMAEICPPWAQTPLLLLGTLPALAVWLGLWWAAYPAEYVIRSQRTLVGLEAGWPAFAPPTLREHLVWHLRTNMLFTLSPIVGIFVVRDLAQGVLLWSQMPLTPGVDLGVSAGSALLVLLLVPLALVRILPTRPLPASPLRAGLEAMCHAEGLRYRDIRLWESGGLLANAAVMGVLPQTRYLILSDLVIEAMPPRQVLAVFAHETAHVVHHHLAWMGVTVVTFMLGAEVAGRTVMPWAASAAPKGWQLPPGLVELTLGLPLFILFFGYISRGFERQADLLGARILGGCGQPEFVSRHALRTSPPTPEGAMVMASALDRIAALNHINPARWEWLHGSILSRCQYLESVAGEPEKARAFDRRMWRLCAGLLTLAGLLAGAVVWLAA